MIRQTRVRQILLLLGIWCMMTGVAAAGPRILASTFPVYQIVRNVIQDSTATVDLMVPATLGCPHDYALTPQDMRKLAAAEVFVINGLGLEEFLGAPLKRANAKIHIVDSSADLTDLLMQTEDDHGRDDHGGPASPNPHAYVSPIMAGRMAESVARQLAAYYPTDATVYMANAAHYKARMQDIARQATVRTQQLKNPRIVTQHGVFDYLARDLGLNIVAVIQAHPGQDPAAADMLRLIENIRTSGAGAIFAEPQYPRRVAQTIARETGIPLADLDPGATSPVANPANAPLDSAAQTLLRNLAVLEQTLGLH